MIQMKKTGFLQVLHVLWVLPPAQRHAARLTGDSKQPIVNVSVNGCLLIPAIYQPMVDA